MAPSISRACLPPSPDGERAGDPYALEVLSGFYRFHARIYDWTRPFLLFGRRRVVDGLGVEAGHLVVDVGCGTGWSLPHLARSGARVIGVECSPAMRARAETRIRRQRLRAVRLDPQPYGAHDGFHGNADRILFSYSLSMIPPFEDVLDIARHDLKPGGRIGVVDFLDAAEPFPARAFRASHVHLGPERLRTLCRLFPRYMVRIRLTGLWRYFLFWGE